MARLLVLGVPRIFQRTYTAHLAFNLLRGMAGNVANARHEGLYVQRLQVFSENVPHTATGQAGIVGLAADVDIAHATATYLYLVGNELMSSPRFRPLVCAAIWPRRFRMA